MIEPEILEAFIEETQTLIEELSEITEEFENTNNPKLLENFGQTIDRIMGAAYTLELNDIGRFCELGKKIGYKASQVTDKDLIHLTGPILADTADILKDMIESLIDKSKAPNKESLNAFGERLKWFLDKFNNISRASTGS